MKSIVSRIMDHCKSVLSKKDNLLEKLRFQVEGQQKANEALRCEMECLKKDNSRLLQEAYEQSGKLALYDEIAGKMDFYNQLRQEVIILRQRNGAIECEKEQCLAQLARKQELLDFLEKSNVNGRIDFRKLEQNFLLLKKENSALKVKMTQQETLIANLKQDEARLKNKIRTLWNCPVPGGLESLSEPD